MDVRTLILSLTRFPKILRGLVEGLEDEQWRWRPPTGHWSILEIVCHLGDEEVEDFRTRLTLTLDQPTTAWPPIDPEGVAKSRDYQAADPEQALQRFLDERERSLSYLNGLADVQWENIYQHPVLGPISAGDLLGSWAAHDLLHVRQIAKRQFEWCEAAASPHRLDYAGTW